MNSGDIPVFHTFSPETASISHLFILVLIVCGVILAIVIGMIGHGLIFSSPSRCRARSAFSWMSQPRYLGCHGILK